MTRLRDMPAYPTTRVESLRMSDGTSGAATVDYPGLTKREAFAMAAMQGMLAATAEYRLFDHAELSERTASVVRSALRVADALCEALEREGKP